MRCQRVQKNLPAYHDGELSPRVRAQIFAHLKGCALCAQEEALLSQVEGLLLKMPRITPSAEFAQTFWRRLEREGDLEEEIPLLRRWQRLAERWSWTPALAAVTAALLLIVVSAYLVLSPQSERSRAPSAPGLPRQLVEQPDFFLNYRILADMEKFAELESVLVREGEAFASSSAPQSPPSEVLKDPEFFVHYDLLLKMDELQNFEAVRELLHGGENGGRRQA